MTRTFHLDEGEAQALQDYARGLGIESVETHWLTLRCQFETALRNYLQTPTTCTPYHTSMETLNRWIEEGTR